MVANGVMDPNSKMPVKLMTKYGVQAMNHNEMVIKATLANLHSALVFWASCERNEATFIFLACSRMFFSWAVTACGGVEWLKIEVIPKNRASYLNNEPVRVDDHEEWHVVDKETVDQDVWTAAPVLGEVVSSASGHVAFWDISIPSEEWQQSPE